MSHFKTCASYDAKHHRQLAHGLFAGQDTIELTDKGHGRATIGKFMVGNVIVGDVRSTGHEVEVAEPFAVSILVPLQGRIVSVACGETRTAQAGSGALIFSPNRRKTRVVAPQDGEFHAIPLVIPFSEIARSAERMGVSLQQLRRARPFSFELDPRSQTVADELLGFCRLLHSEVARGSRRLNLAGAQAHWSDTLCEKAVELLDEAGLLQVARPVAGDSTNSRHVKRAMDYMRANAADIVLIAEVAAACGVSSRTLESAFRGVTGMTPMQVMTSVRLDEVRSRLLDRTTNASVTDIALACGFRHLGRFSRAYGYRFGELPSETRGRR